MLVSVIIPMYNVAGLVERCARSLLGQTCSDMELIFVDDGSTDATVDVLQQCLADVSRRDVVVKLLRHEVNRGCAKARLTGMKAATGEYMVQVDSDDYVETCYIERLVAKAVSTQSDVVMCDYYVLQPDGEHVVNVSLPAGAEDCLCLFLQSKLHNGLWNKLIRSRLITDNQIYPIEGMNMYDDKSVMVRVMHYAQRITHLSEPLYHYNRTNPASLSLQSKSHEIDDALGLVKLIDDFYPLCEVSPQVRDSIIYHKAHVMGMVLLHAQNQGHLNEAYRFLKSIAATKIWRNPMSSWYYKLVLLAHKCHLWPIETLLRWATARYAKKNVK